MVLGPCLPIPKQMKVRDRTEGCELPLEWGWKAAAKTLGMGEVFTHAMPGAPCLRLSRKRRTRFERQTHAPFKVTQSQLVPGFCPPSLRYKGNRAQ